MKFHRDEYPRPQFRRDDWIGLNGEWEFAFDDEDEGLVKGYDRGERSLPQRINVPFSYQYEASGIGDRAVHEIIWYRRIFTIDAAHSKRRALLCFNGCDYLADVWIGGIHVAQHIGAYSYFQVDVTPFLKEGSNVIVVRCYDPLTPGIPRGKQSWKADAFACWYVPNTGIWQSVWLEFFDDDCIAKYSMIADAATYSIGGEIRSLRGLADSIEIEVFFRGDLIKKQSFSLDREVTRYRLMLMEPDYVDESFLWTPHSPNLFYADLRLMREGRVVDEAHTRFGLRDICVDEHGNIRLNNEKFYQRLVLDQGYWRESGMTPPSAEALKEDIAKTIAMGFNGARKHQKIEDPYYYYYAEEMGLVTWCEMPSAYRFGMEEMAVLMREWAEILQTAQNFTSNICYVPLNESWGVRKILTDRRQQSFANAMYEIAKALDPTRLVSTNDGWENPDRTDLTGIHDYTPNGEMFGYKFFRERFGSLYPQNRKLIADGCNYHGQPALLTEFGGIALKTKDGGWGYGERADSAEAFFTRLESLLNGIYDTQDLQGFCYTQLTDVQQEVNGLLDEDHRPKFDMEHVARTIRGR